MSDPNDLRASVRRELSLSSPTRRSRRSRLLRVSAVAALLWSLAGSPAPAQPPFQQEVVPGLSSLDADIFSKPDLADLDGDGDLDLVTGERSGRFQYFENTGTSEAPAFVGRSGDADPFAGIALGTYTGPDLADLDGDGDLDAILATADGLLAYFENSGTAATPAFVERTGSENPFQGLAVGFRINPDLVDLDTDGDLDAVIGESYGRLVYLENTGSTSSPAFVKRTGAANPFDGIDVGRASSPALMDLDSDRDLDLVVGNDLFENTAIYFENTGTTSSPAFVERSGSASPFDQARPASESTPALGDLDGDGDFDVVVGGAFGGLSYLENTGTSTSPGFVDRLGSASPIGGSEIFRSSPDLADLDGDGDRDAVVGSHLSGLLYFENTGTSADPRFQQHTGSANPFDGLAVGQESGPALADLDGDGDLDAVVGGLFTGLAYHENTGSSSAPAFVTRTGSSDPFDGIGSGTRPELVDLDGDGDFDLVNGSTNGSVTFVENTGSSTAPAFVERSGSANPFDGFDFVFNNEVGFVDLDGDGDADAAVGGGYVGTLTYLENTGSSTAPAFVERTGSSNPFLGIQLGADIRPDLVDLDSDGDLDLVAGEEGGGVVFFRSKANDLFADGFETGDTSAWSAVVP